ncbi:MAG: sulfotransferase [Armatimonadota bacterium]
MEGAPAANPILVVGMNRGGTTLLCNVLCRHPQVDAPKHRLHWGCHECQVLRHAQYWGDLTDTGQFIRFMELYSSGDFFTLAEGDKEYFYAHRPRDFYEFFLTLMEQFAARRQIPYWVMKLDERFYHRPRELERFLSLVRGRYTDPRCIGILRDFGGVLKSHLRRRVSSSEVGSARFSIGHQWFAVSQTLRYAAQRPKIRRIVAEADGLLLDFSELVGDFEAASRRICTYLDLEYSPQMLERQFPPNTSFKDDRERREIISPWQLALLDNLVRPVFEAAHPLSSAWRRIRDAQGSRTCPLSWRLLRERRGLGLPEDTPESG